MGMEPVSPQGAALPIWVGGDSPAALRRTAEKADGWMASGITDEQALLCVENIRQQAEELGRGPNEIGFQLMLQPPPRTDEDKLFYADLDAVAERAAVVRAMGFEWTSVNATAVFQAGARSVDAMIEQLDVIHGRIRSEVG